MKRRTFIFLLVVVISAAAVLMGMLVPACGVVRRSRTHVISAVTEGGTDQFISACHALVEKHKVPTWQYRELDLARETLPEPLASITVKTAIVMHDCVEIWLEDPGRAGILCFTAGAHEYGTTLITNGVWFWNGTPSAETRGNYEDWVRKNREHVR